jgi:energy-coupling factor transporter ATP-binding protein EcfA2
MKKIEIKNFRVLKDKQSIVFKPITILVGPNNSGKSTVYNSLKLIEHSNSFNRFQFPVVLDSKLGTNFSNDISQINADPKQPLEINFKVPFLEKIHLDLRLKYKDLVLFSYSLEYDKKVIFSEINTETMDFKGESVLTFENSFFDLSTLRILLKHYVVKQKKMLEVGLKKLDAIRGDWDDLGMVDIEYNKLNEELKLTNRIGKTLNSDLFVLVPNDELIGLPENEQKQFSEMTKEFDRALNFKSFDNLKYGKLVRKYDDWILLATEKNFGELSTSFKFWVEILKYELKSNLGGIGITKEIIGSDLLKFMDDLFVPFIEIQIKKAIDQFTKIEKIPSTKSFKNKYVYLNEKADTYFNEVAKLIFFQQELPPNDRAGIDYINTWLKKFEIGTEVIPERLNNDIGELFILDMSGRKINVADMGFGVQQILAFISTPLKYFGNPKHYMNSDHSEYGGSDYGHREDSPFLFLEEPESNLHPRWQTTLIELIVEMKRTFGIHFLIETHSEYMIRKLQYLIGKKNYQIKSEEVAVYYINRDQDVSKKEPKMKEIIIREDGILANSFGPGFFDEATKLTIDLLTIKNYN